MKVESINPSGSATQRENKELKKRPIKKGKEEKEQKKHGKIDIKV